jgi:signal peptidase II
VANLADRATGGTVVDYLDLGWWPTFNLADVAITCGAALLVVYHTRHTVPGVPAAG